MLNVRIEYKMIKSLNFISLMCHNLSKNEEYNF